MADSTGDKKHEATPYRRQKAREKGQVARSQDLGSALVLLVSVGILWWTGSAVADALARVMQASLTQQRYWTLDAVSASGWFVTSLLECLMALLPLMLGVMAAILVNNWLQMGFLFLPEKLAFDIRNIDPLKGLQRLFSLRNATRLGFGLLKITLVACVIVFGLWTQWDAILGAYKLPVLEIGRLVWDTTMQTCMWTAVLLLVLAVADYGFQWWKMEQDLRMTDQELRDELKMMNGDPQILMRRREVQRQLALSRMQSAVPQADVVITNPTELAIAIKYDPTSMAAPVVVAKGAGYIAARIRKLALAAGVPVLERKPLARALFENVEVGQQVPAEQYAAVAEVLRYVYQLQGKELPKAG
ncbi:MAG: flagellar biosynthesis protein FlhB [Planctomycetota bacterium]|nr:MAG: flagellar biosynthesis protein FlhB [Planctomycetota bacterium]